MIFNPAIIALGWKGLKAINSGIDLAVEASFKKITITYVNGTGSGIELALCVCPSRTTPIGPEFDVSGGWEFIPAGRSYSVGAQVPRWGMDFAFYARGNRIESPDGDLCFYVIRNCDDFQINGATTTHPKITQGDGELEVVSAGIRRIADDYSLTLN
jgi:hypothetical protein